MYKKILVPLDGSQLSELALPYSGELAVRLGSEVTLVYVIPSVDEWYHVHQLYLEEMEEIVKWGAKRHVDKLVGKEITVDSIVLIGHPAEEIVNYADRADIDLIVMATHGRSGIKRWTLGSVADEVVKTTHRPVIFIRAKDAYPGIHEEVTLNRVLVPLDGSKEGEAVIPYVKELAPKLNAEVILLRVLSRSYQTVTTGGYGGGNHLEQLIELDEAHAKDYLEKVGAQLKNEGVMVKSEVVLGAAAEEIIKLADETDAGVVAMSTHGRSGVKRWVFGSVANRILHAGNTPLLLVKAPEAVEEESSTLEEIAGVK